MSLWLRSLPGDGSITRSTVTIFQESFDSDDKDGDGFLNQDEFCNALMIKFDGEIDIESCFDTFPTFDMDQDLKLSCQGKIHIGLATVT